MIRAIKQRACDRTKTDQKSLENTTAYKWDHIGTTYATTEMTTPYYEVGGKVKSFLGLLTVYKMDTR